MRNTRPPETRLSTAYLCPIDLAQPAFPINALSKPYKPGEGESLPRVEAASAERLFGRTGIATVGAASLYPILRAEFATHGALMSDDGRTTPLGLFNYARSYWQSGVLLHHAGVKVSHPDAPVTLLMAHAVELYLKAFLRVRGLSAQEVKHSFGHDFIKLVQAAWDRGLALTDEDREMATILKEQESIRRSRYVETGYFKRPALAALSGMCRRLDETVAAALKSAGIRIRLEKLADIIKE
jgi:HEPN domain-containing protein